MLNSTNLMGRLVEDPELKFTPTGVHVVKTRIAVDRDYKADGKEREADFIDIVVWRSSADFLCKYFKKGQLITIEGRIRTRSYTDKNGIKRRDFAVVADRLHFTGPKPETKPEADASTNSPQKVGCAGKKVEEAPPANVGGDFDDYHMSDDDLPF